MCVRSRLRCGPEAGEQAPRQPDAAEVVDSRDLLDEVEIDVRELAAGGHARVVDERVDGRVPLEDARGERLDGRAVTDVARLGLATCLLGQRAQPVFAARDEDAVPPRVASSRAVASPIPEDAPVMTAIRCTVPT